MPGQFARLRMGRRQADAGVLVSERAIGTDQNKKFVMVVDDDNKAAYREVTLGAFVDGLRVVTQRPEPASASSSTACSACGPARWWRRKPVPMDGRSAAGTPTPSDQGRAVALNRDAHGGTGRHEHLQVLHRPADLRRRAVGADLPRRLLALRVHADLRISRGGAALGGGARAVSRAPTRR